MIFGGQLAEEPHLFRVNSLKAHRSVHSIPHRSGKRGQNKLDKIGQGGSLGEHRGSKVGGKVGGKQLDLSVQYWTSLDDKNPSLGLESQVRECVGGDGGELNSPSKRAYRRICYRHSQ